MYLLSWLSTTTLNTLNANALFTLQKKEFIRSDFQVLFDVCLYF